MDGRIGGVVVSRTESKQAYWGNAGVTARFREEGLQLGGVNEEGMKVDAVVKTEQFWRYLDMSVNYLRTMPLTSGCGSLH